MDELKFSFDHGSSEVILRALNVQAEGFSLKPVIILGKSDWNLVESGTNYILEKK